MAYASHAPRIMRLRSFGILVALLATACTASVEDSAEPTDPPQAAADEGKAPLAHPVPAAGEGCISTVLPDPTHRLHRIVIIECPQPYFYRGDPPPDARLSRQPVEQPADTRPVLGIQAGQQVHR